MELNQDMLFDKPTHFCSKNGAVKVFVTTGYFDANGNLAFSAEVMNDSEDRGLFITVLAKNLTIFQI